MKRPRDDWLPVTSQRLPSARPTRRAKIRDGFTPTSLEELPPPSIDPYLSDQLWSERITKTLAFTVLDVERWLFPCRGLRKLLRATLALALAIAMPVFILMPVITATLSYLNLSTAELLATFTNLSLSAQEIVKATLIVFGGIVTLRLLIGGNLLAILALLAAFASGWWHGW